MCIYVYIHAREGQQGYLRQPKTDDTTLFQSEHPWIVRNRPNQEGSASEGGADTQWCQYMGSKEVQYISALFRRAPITMEVQSLRQVKVIEGSRKK